MMENVDSLSIEKKRRDIVSYIEKYIKRNNLQENDSIPSENKLAQLFNVNRNTVRSSLAILKARGVIYSQKGKGFFVLGKPKIIVFKHDNALGFSEILNKGHRDYTSEVINVKISEANAREQKLLKLEEGDMVYRLKHVRSLNGSRFSVCTSIVPVKRVPDFDSHLDNFFSVNNILINDYHYPHPICKWIELTAALPSNEDIQLLDIKENLPILKQESVFHVDGVGNVEYFIVRARGDVFRFTMSFK